MNILRMRTGSLSPTATYKRREWVWVPADPHAPPGVLGALALVQIKSAKPDVKVECDLYAVTIDGDGFELAHAEERMWYYCRPAVSWCSCLAGVTGIACKHLAALAALTEEGLI